MDKQEGGDQPGLNRRIGLAQMVFFGLGTVLGAGIYVLVGKVSLAAGMLAPLAFLVAALVAWVTAMSYSQLVVLLPLSAGEAAYTDAAFRRAWLTRLTGLMIIFTGIVSAATLAVGFIGYLNEFVPVPRSSGVVAVLVLLGGFACWGIRQSMWMLVAMTSLEVGGLVWVIAACGDVLSAVPAHASELFLPSGVQWLAVMSGAFLAFYAFIGFEDMVNVAEEVVRPDRTMPRAIVIVIVLSTVLYMLVATIAVLSLPLETLQNSVAPMSDVLRSRYPDAARWIAAISVVAILNGVLAQVIMAARVLYGMAEQGRLPGWFARINVHTRTPVRATVVIVALIMLAALALPLATLAQSTSFIVLLVFTLVNLALYRLGRREGLGVRLTLPHYPRLGALLCLLLLAAQFVALVAGT